MDKPPAWVTAHKPKKATPLFDELAERFYNDTGVIAPGKDIPAEMGMIHDEFELRVKLYKMWLENETLRSTLRTAMDRLDKLESTLNKLPVR